MGLAMKTDARVRYTKMVIKNSFATLLAQKPLSKVTVKEICELSEINRATFYKHYHDPYDLLDCLETEFLDTLLKRVDRSFSIGFNETFAVILKQVQTDGELYRALFSDNGDPHFPARIMKTCYQRWAASTVDDRLRHLDGLQREWLFYYIAQGCSGVLTQWVENGMAEPIDQVTDFVDSLIASTLSSIELRPSCYSGR